MNELPRRTRRLVTGALLTGALLASLEAVVVSPAMPAVVGDLGGAGLYPWVFTAFIATQTLSMLGWGILADRWGRRNSYALGVSIFLVGSLACALAPDMGFLVAARAFQGLGAGALLPLTITIFGDLYPVAERTRMQGWFSLIWGLSSLFGPLVGGFITDTWSWRGIFWLNLPPGLVAAGVVVFALPAALGLEAPSPTTQRPSWRVLLVSPTQQAINVSGVLFGAALIGIISYLPVYVQAVQGGTATAAGIALIPLSVAWTVAANVCGYLVGRHGFRNMARAGSLLVCLGALGSGLLTAHPAGFVLFGFGMGLLISTFNVAAQEDAPNALKGIATSATLFARSMGGAICVPLLGLLAGLDPAVADFGDIPHLDLGMARVFQAIGVASVLAALVVWVRFPADAPPCEEAAAG